jgi:hypothetical protein
VGFVRPGYECPEFRIERGEAAENASMKAYVNYYDGDGARARETIRDDSIRDDQCVVQFSASPDN